MTNTGPLTVLVISTKRRDWQDRIGVLLREYDEPLLDEEARQYSSVHHWVLETNHGEFDWRDARFIRVPMTDHQGDLYQGHARRCALASCTACARETWTLGASGDYWKQRLRA